VEDAAVERQDEEAGVAAVAVAASQFSKVKHSLRVARRLQPKGHLLLEVDPVVVVEEED